MPHLDSPTIFIQSLLTYAALAGMLVYYQVAHRTYPGFRDLVGFSLGMTLSLLLLLAYPAGRLPHPLHFLAANGILVAAGDRLMRGIARFVGLEPRLTPGEGLFYGLGMVAITWFAYGVNRFDYRAAVISLLLAAPAWRAGRLLRAARPGERSAARILAVILQATAVLDLARGAVALRWSGTPEVLRRTGLEALVVILLVVASVAIIIGFLSLTAQRAQAERAEAQAQVAELEGIIPICMYCHKVRDDQQAWNELERYIATHTKAEFSHGICPDCRPRFFTSAPGSAGTS